MATDIVPQMKRCGRCEVEKPATREFFNTANANKDGLHIWCRQCQSEYAKEYWDKRQITEDEREARRVRKRKHYQENRDRILAEAKTPKVKEQQRIWRKAHPLTPEQKERKRQQKVEYRRRKGILSRAEFLEQRRKENEKNKPIKPKKERGLGRKLSTLANDFIRVKREQAKPKSFTTADWERCLEYFNWCCAACGRQMRDLFGEHTPSADHWIPISLSECPGTIPTNVVPLCHGKGGCNNSKGKKHPDNWLEQRFNKRQAKEIKDRVERYFEWVKEQDNKS